MRPPPRPLEEPYRSRAVPPGTVRYWSWLFAARDSRAPLLGIYALLTEWRALMDPGTEAAVAQLKLAWWQEEMQRLTAGSPVHPISRYLAALPRADVAEFAPLERAVEAAARHIAGAPLERSKDLEAHASALRGGPYIVAARLAGERPPGSAAGLEQSVGALAAAEYLAATIADYRREARSAVSHSRSMSCLPRRSRMRTSSPPTRPITCNPICKHCAGVPRSYSPARSSGCRVPSEHRSAICGCLRRSAQSI